MSFRLLRDSGGRTVFETLLVVMMVSIFFYIALGRYVTGLTLARETALGIELSNLRTAVSLYAAAKGKLPQSLKTLVGEKMLLVKHGLEGREYELTFQGRYVEGMTTDHEGYPTDVFGNRFDYDPYTGRVWSSTKGYESW